MAQINVMITLAILFLPRKYIKCEECNIVINIFSYVGYIWKVDLIKKKIKDKKFNN